MLHGATRAGSVGASGLRHAQGSRTMGVLSQLFWDRALGLPLERPKSLTPEWIVDYCEKQEAQ